MGRELTHGSVGVNKVRMREREREKEKRKKERKKERKKKRKKERKRHVCMNEQKSER